MDGRLEMAKGARRAVIASWLGLRGRDVIMGAMAKSNPRSVVEKVGDREGARAWLGHGHGRRAAVVMHCA